MISLRRVLLAAVFACGLGACASAEPQAVEPVAPATPATATPAGTWDLVAIDGVKVPTVPVDRDRPPGAPAAPEVVSGRLVMNAAGSFTQQLVIRAERGGEQQTMSREFTGTWRREGEGYVLEWQGAGRTPATFTGDTLTYDNAGMLLRFQRVR